MSFGPKISGLALISATSQNSMSLDVTGDVMMSDEDSVMVWGVISANGPGPLIH